MKPILHLHNIEDLSSFMKNKTRHPLVDVLDFSKIDEHIEEGTRLSCDFYMVMFKNYCANKFRYGRQVYDFQDGSLICIAPKQVLTMDNEIEKKENMVGWGLFFHPDLIHGTSLGSKMKSYSFFSYETNEALHLSEKERKIVLDCFGKIKYELEQRMDNHSKTLISANIELLTGKVLSAIIALIR